MSRPARSIPRRPRPTGKPDAPIPATPREAAFRAVAAHAAHFPDLLPAHPATDRLDPRDAALARALYEATLRRWRTLAFLLNTRLRRPMTRLEPGLQATLLLGAAQILLMDRVPDHAAINESVELTKRHVRPGAAKLANAVLRALAALRDGLHEDLDPTAALDRRDALPRSDGSVLRLAEDLFPEHAPERTALVTGLPAWLATRWHDRYPQGRARELCLHTLVVPPVIVNAAHARDPLGPIEDWPAHDEPGFRVAPADADIGAALAGRRDLWVQDPASAAGVAALPDAEPALVIDACAGQGTKTRQLAHRFPNATIVASDTDESRMATLRALADALPNVTTCPAADLPYRHAGQADLVLLDVPCTNTGVLARRVEARHRCSQRQLDRLADAQRQIIADSIRLLAPNAQLLYVTCSLEPEETESQAEWTTRWHALHTTDLQTRLPAGLPGGPPTAYRDGASWALLGGPARPPRSR